MQNLVQDLNVLFKAIDTDKDNKVSYEEFIKPIVGELSARRFEYIETAFKLIDKDNNGIISKEDISRTFDGFKHPDVKQGKKTPEDLLHEILDVLDISVNLHVFCMH